MEDETTVREDDVDAAGDESSAGGDADQSGQNGGSENAGGENQQQNKDGQENEQGNADQNQQGERTEKGTRLAEDPLQRANQLRANAERERDEMVALLSDPDQVTAYLQELQKEMGVTKKEMAQESETGEIKIEDVNDKATMQKYLKQETDKMHNILKQQEQSRNQESLVKQVERAVGSAGTQIAAVKDKYPELREKNPDGTPNPDFDRELEARIGARWEKTFVPVRINGKVEMVPGKTSLEEIAEDMMFAVNRGRSRGSAQARTTILDKRTGAPRSGANRGQANQQADESKMTSAQKIARRIAQSQRTRR